MGLFDLGNVGVLANVSSLEHRSTRHVKKTNRSRPFQFTFVLADIPHLHFRGVFFKFFHLLVLRV